MTWPFRVVCDTNVFVNRFRPCVARREIADGRRLPLSHEFFDRWFEDEFVLLLCLEAWYEIIEQLEQQHVPRNLIERLGVVLQELCDPVDVVSTNRWCIDPDDDKFLRLAIDGGASHLVTNDRHLMVPAGPFNFRRARLPGFIKELREELRAHQSAPSA